MKSIFFFSAFVVLTALWSCKKCYKDVTCPALSDDGQRWLSPNQFDTIKFTDGLGTHLRFAVIAKKISFPYGTQECASERPGCTCSLHQCAANGAIDTDLLPDDTTMHIPGIYYIEVIQLEGFYHNDYTIGYHIGDFEHEDIDLMPNAKPMQAGDTLVPSLTLGGHSYSNVYIQKMDTNKSGYENKKVWMAYITQQNGIVAFRTRQNQDFFYRE